MALAAIRAGRSLQGEVESRGSDAGPAYAELQQGGRILPPLDHEDSAHCLISGTGLTHLGSASTRDKMHQQKGQDEAALTDTMRMFRWGLEGGKPGAGKVGAQPEWFYKGDGSIVAWERRSLVERATRSSSGLLITMYWEGWNDRRMSSALALAPMAASSAALSATMSWNCGMSGCVA